MAFGLISALIFGLPIWLVGGPACADPGFYSDGGNIFGDLLELVHRALASRLPLPEACVLRVPIVVGTGSGVLSGLLTWPLMTSYLLRTR
jgi:hypothetical protein